MFRLGSASSRQELLRVIRSVRRRWRVRMLLRGLGIVLGGGLLAFLISAYAMDQLRFSPAAVWGFRFLAYGAVIVLAARFLIRPLLRRVNDERVALYLEEHEPSLEGSVLSAVEVDPDSDLSVASPALVRQVVEAAVERCARLDGGRRVDRDALRRSSGILAAAAVLSLVVLSMSPTFLRHSAPFLFAPWSGDGTENPYRIDVAPGNTVVARGADLRVSADLANFDADEVDIAVKREGAPWERWAMTRDEETGSYLFLIFDLEASAEYFVEASGVRSPLFRIDVEELPYVDELTLEYRFPAYTGLRPRQQEDGGDIAALRGTRVILEVTPTLPVAGGLLRVDSAHVRPLTLADDGVLTGDLSVQRPGFYRIEFVTASGDTVPGSPDYTIDLFEDQPPAASFARPGRDVKVTSIEEVFTEVEAEDDYGVDRLELIYSVNGGPEQTIRLYDGLRKELRAGHTFFLEELALRPGDFIAYHARASEAADAPGARTAVTDIYFMEIRPFDTEYRQADQRGGMGGSAFDAALAQRQREIIAATFNLIRDRERYDDSEYRENLATLALSQGRLREQVETLVRRIRTRGVVEIDSTFRTIAEALPRAAEEMAAAEELLGVHRPEEALGPEQRALQQLQRAEAAYREVTVARGGGGGAGGSSASAEELADLFELELDRMRNQYEQVQRGRRQQVDERIDETLEKLRELARRQQQENERMRARASRQDGGGGGGRSQRRLAEEAEELARRLERLARERSLPDMRNTARELQRAAEEMRRAAADDGDGGVGEGQSALDRLRAARERLERDRSDRMREQVEDALRRAERLAEEQRDVTDDVERLDTSDADHAERVQRLMERKAEMAAEVEGLEGQLERLSRDWRREQRDAAEGLAGAAEAIREGKLREMILYSRGVIQGRSPEYARNFEDGITERIDTVRSRIAEALDQVGASREDRVARALERTNDVVRALESLEDRIRERARGQGDGAGGRESEQGDAETRGAPGAPGGAGGLEPTDARQFRRELRERREEMGRLREDLAGEGIGVEDLDRLIDRMGALAGQVGEGDPRGLEELSSEVIQGLKEFEYAVRRSIEGQGARTLMLSGSDHVPAGFRELVEEYYRALAERSRE